MRCRPCAGTASYAAASSPAGACFGATPGAVEASTRSDDALHDPDPQPARDRDEARSPLVPHEPPPAVGVGDRRDDGRGADAPRAADDQADPLDAEPAEARAADEGDPEEVQAGSPEAERGADEVLPGEQHQPGRLVPADAPAAAGLHRALLHAPELRVELQRGSERGPLVPPLHPGHQRAHDVVLGRLRAAVRLRRKPDGFVVFHDDYGGQDAAHPLHGHAALLRLHHRALPRWPRPLLGHDEPVDSGTGADHAATGCQDARAGTRAPQLANASETGDRPGHPGRRGSASPGQAGRSTEASPGSAQEEAHEPEMSEIADLTSEATGATVGEAKWAALRELERRYPGLDKAAVQFEVVAEGERGILGVGYEPARVVAHLPAEAAEAVAAAEPAAEEGSQAGEARTLVAQIVETLGVDADVVAHDEPEAIVVTCSGPDVGLLIGRHGQTIDAVQYLLNVIGYRAYGDDKRDVVVDAAGYRSRRQATLESLADRVAERVLESGEPEELEPMTAVERKVVHLRLKEVAGIGTTSEGTEPNSYVVVVPD